MAHAQDPFRSSDQLHTSYFDYIAPPRTARPMRGRPIHQILDRPRVVDDWPATVPVCKAELDILEIHLAEVLDIVFGPLSN